MSTLTHAGISVNKIMYLVIIACLPGIFVTTFYFGWDVLKQIALAIISGLILETLMLKVRNRPVFPFITDGSTIITAILLAACIPPIASWWVIAIGMVFAIVLAKHIYGGIGNNLFNPAMVGYAVLLIAFPQQMTQWQINPILANFDGVTGATPLDSMKNNLLSATIDYWPWINLAWLSGGIFLILKRIISWHIPVSVLLGLLIPTVIYYLTTHNPYYLPGFQLSHGAIMIGAFFIATDPVTAPTYIVNRLIFGFAIGLLTFIIRTNSVYPEGIAFAVLLMNLCVPLLDSYIKPRTFGHPR